MILSNACVLHDRYSIQSVLGDVGPFDVNYLAWDLKEEREVVVREYYPVRLAKRARDGMHLEVNDPRLFEYGLGAYLAESALLMEVKHQQVVACIDQFKQNGTVYYVSDYLSGASLSAYIRQHQGRISEEDALEVVRGVLKALEACHERNLYHAGITPKSIYMTLDGRAMLISFQSARFKAARRCDALQDVLHAGFSAPELGASEAADGPGADVFGCAATLLYMLSGRVPPALTMPSEAGRIQTALHRASSMSQELRGILDRALAYYPADRPATAYAFGEMLVDVAEGASRRLHAGAPRPMLHVGIELEEEERDAVWHGEVEIVASAPSEHHESSAHKHPMLSGADKPMLRESSEIVPTNITAYTQPSNGQERAVSRAVDNAATGREKELEQLVVKMVKSQQVFVGIILSVVVLALVAVIGGLFLAPGFAQRLFAEPSTPAPARAQASMGAVPMAAPVLSDQPAALPLTDSLAANEEQVLATLQGDMILGASDSIRSEEGGGESSTALYAEARASRQSAVQDAEDEAERSTSGGDAQESRSAESRDRSSSQESRSTESRNRSGSSESRSTESQGRSSSQESRSTEPEDRSSLQESRERASSPATTDDQAQTDDGQEEDAEGTPTDSIAVAPLITAEALAERTRNEQFAYYRAQGDSLIQLGFYAAALHNYQSAKRIRPGDVYIDEQLEVIQEQLRRDERQQQIADSLKVRIAKVTDSDGYFISPDTPLMVVDEEGFRRKIRYPFAASRAGITGRVTVQYLVDASGRFVTARMLNRVGGGCDEEVIRALREEARFSPATFNGQPVAAWSRFSVVFGSN